MNQRYTFQCWQCDKTYTLLREITSKQSVKVACPYCHHEAVVDLAPYLKQIKEVLRGAQSEADSSEELDLPAVLPTRKPD